MDLEEATHNIISHITSLDLKLEGVARRNVRELAELRNQLEVSLHDLCERISDVRGRSAFDNVCSTKIGSSHSRAHAQKVKALFGYDSCAPCRRVRWPRMTPSRKQSLSPDHCLPPSHPRSQDSEAQEKSKTANSCHRTDPIEVDAELTAVNKNAEPAERVTKPTFDVEGRRQVAKLFGRSSSQKILTCGNGTMHRSVLGTSSEDLPMQGDVKDLSKRSRQPSSAHFKVCWGFCRGSSTFEVYFRDFMHEVFGISEPDASNGLSGSAVIDPSSPFSTFMEMLSACLLAYSLVMVPLQLSFWYSPDPCTRSGTLEFDLFVDTFFMVEIVFTFFTGVIVDGTYSDNLPVIARMYVGSITRFWFDLLTSIPFSWIDFYTVQVCSTTPDVVDDTWAQNIYTARTIKPLRIFKMTRILKLFRQLHEVLRRLEVRPSQERVAHLSLALFAFMHIFACAFWRVKIEVQSEQEVVDFLAARSVDPRSASDLYVTCIYFVCTVLTTTGFGDISAVCFGERIFMICLMFCAALIFGLVLGEMQQIFAVSNAKARERDERIDSINSFLEQSKVPRAVVRRVKNWVWYQYLSQKADKQSRDVMDSLPAEIREELAGAINAGLFSRVPLFMHIPDGDLNLKDKFTAALIRSMSSAFYLAGAYLTRYTDDADRLMIICSGSVGVYLPGQTAPLAVLRARDSFGDNCLLGDPRFGGVFGVDADFIARENCKVVYVSAQAVREIVKDRSFVRVRRLLELFQYEPDDPKGLWQFEAVEAREGRTTYRWIRAARALLQLPRAHADHDFASSVTRLMISKAASIRPEQEGPG